MSAVEDLPEGTFPEISRTLRLETEGEGLYEAAFYPFGQPGTDPVFAFAFGVNTVVCTPSTESKRGIDILRWFKDENPNAGHYCVAWSVDCESGHPLICVSGDAGKIRVLDVTTGLLVTTLVGHGAAVNRIAISPVSPNILASASNDHTIRLWNLRPKYRQDPCRVMLAGWGHKSEVSYIDFHHTGRYMVSAGIDTRICVWVLPDICIDKGVNDNPADKTTFVYNPHFITEEIHPRLIDCVRFYGDFILSKCLNPPDAKILLWRIVGFSSEGPTPPAKGVPNSASTVAETSSAFYDAEIPGAIAFHVLLSFNMPQVNYHYHYFGLYHRPAEHPVLAVGTSTHWISFWDLQLIEQGKLGAAILRRPSKGRSKKAQSASADSAVRIARAKDDKITKPLEGLRPHMALRLPSHLFRHPNRRTDPYRRSVRSVNFSSGGEWCVALGDEGLICLMYWRSKDKDGRFAPDESEASNDSGDANDTDGGESSA